MLWEDVLFAFADACPIGVRSGNRVGGESGGGESGGVLRLNPPDDYVLRKGDEIVVIAEDDDTYEAVLPEKLKELKKPKHDGDSGGAKSESELLQSYVAATYAEDQIKQDLPTWEPVEQHNENVLLCGWRRDLYDMLTEVNLCEL